MASKFNSNNADLELNAVGGDIVFKKDDVEVGRVGAGGAGKVLQVVSITPDIPLVTVASASWVEPSSLLRLEITPKSATSKLLIEFSFLFGGNYQAAVSGFKIYDLTNNVDLNVSTTGSLRNHSHGAARRMDIDGNDIDITSIRTIIPSGSILPRTYQMLTQSENTNAKYFFSNLTDSATLFIARPMITITEIGA